jgi:trehalose synthase-fused probable maltokinase
MAPSPPVDRRLQRQASAFTAGWLAAQRWYRAKSRSVERVDLIDAAQVGGDSGWLLVLQATDDIGGRAGYLVPAVLRVGSFQEPGDGDGLWASLGRLMLGGGELTGAGGHWSFTPTPAAATFVPGGCPAAASLAERRLGVQQSNTSVALGEELILKVYRLVEAGLNPEVEMNAFLTQVGFREAPWLAGSARYLVGDEEHSAAMLQQRVQSSGDGWSWMLARLAAAPAEALDAVAQIGRLTATLHAALASRPDAPGFPFRAARPEERSAWRAAAEDRLEAAQEALDAATRPRLAALASHIASGFAVLDDAEVQVSRIHGDYHLGQLLRTADGFCVIDFEGEPARPLAERRAPSSPLRDVAGMLRSLDYAAHAARPQPGKRGGWLTEARAAFIAGYGGLRAGEAPILAAFELEKACYEVAYEANNRPDWVWLPLEALERQGGAS